MMDCGDNSAAIELYLDKELSGRELEEFLTHLEGCVDCQAELEEKKELAGLLHRTRPLYTASDALRATVMRRMEADFVFGQQCTATPSKTRPQSFNAAIWRWNSAALAGDWWRQFF